MKNLVYLNLILTIKVNMLYSPSRKDPLAASVLNDEIFFGMAEKVKYDG